MKAKSLVEHIRRSGGDTDFFDGEHLSTIANFIEKYNKEFDEFVSGPSADPKEVKRQAAEDRMKDIAAYIKGKVAAHCDIAIHGNDIVVSYNDNISPGEWFMKKRNASKKKNPHFHGFELNETIPNHGTVKTTIHDRPEVQPF